MAGVVLVLVVSAYALFAIADELDGAADALSDASPGWLAAAAAVEALCYVCIALLMTRLLGPATTLGRSVMFRVSLVTFGLGSVLPAAPAPGFAMATVELRRRGVSVSRISQALMWHSWFNVRAFLTLAVLTGAVALLRGRIPVFAQGAVIGAVLFTAGALVVLSIAVTNRQVGERVAALAGRLPWRGSRPDDVAARVAWHGSAIASLGTSRNRNIMGALALGSWVADALCLRFALIAVGVHRNMSIILIAYVISTLVALVPLLPGGLGLVEAAVPSVLHYYGVPLDAALAGTLAWRALALILPALAGLLALTWLRMPVSGARATAPPEPESG